MPEFDLLCGSFRTQPDEAHNRSPINPQIRAAMSWLWLTLAILLMLSVQGCTHSPHKQEIDTADIRVADQPDSSAWLEPETEDENIPPHGLWERLRRGFKLLKPASSAVATQATHIAESGLPQRAFARASPLLHLMMKEIERRRLPMELVLLPFVESSFLPQAHSPVGAAAPGNLCPPPRGNRDWPSTGCMTTAAPG